MYNYGLMDSMADAAGGVVVVFFLALVGTVLLYYFILPDNKFDSLPTALRFFHEFFKVKKLWLESIMRALFVFNCVFNMLFGIFTMIKGNFLGGLCFIILMPIIARLMYEFFMILILIARNVMELNNKTPWPNGVKTKADSFLATQFDSASSAPNPVRPETPAPDATPLVCPKCGTKLEPDAMFCPVCGNKLK